MTNGEYWCKCEEVDTTATDSGDGGWQEVNNHHSLKGLKKVVPFLAVEGFCVKHF